MINLVGVIHPYFNVIGGAEKTTFYLLDGLAQNNIATKLYTFNNLFSNNPNDIPHLLLAFDNKYSKNKNNLPINTSGIKQNESLKINQLKRSKVPFSLLRKIGETKRLFKILDDHTVTFVMAGGLCMAKNRAKKILVYCNSDFTSEQEFINKQFHGVKSLYYKIIQSETRKSLALLNNENVFLIANSLHTKNMIKNYFKQDAFLVYPPVDIEKFSAKADAIKENKVATISRFSPNKNLDFAQDVMLKLPYDWELVANANSKSEMELHYRMILKSKPNHNIYEGFPEMRIDNLLSRCKVYFHPSKETFGISVIEAIASGCIPIVPDNSAHVETVPLPELRFKNKDDAVNLIQMAMAGRFDHLKEQLKYHIKRFSIKSFQNSMIKLIEGDITN